jgi:acyl homoserine lactone synthase
LQVTIGGWQLQPAEVFMIRLVRGVERDKFADYVDQMHKLRRRVFYDRMGWDVPIVGDWEVDRFDELDPLYILSLDDRHVVRGCARLLPTTGPNMLADVFGVLLPPGETVRSPLIWESSRFAVEAPGDGNAVRNRRMLQQTTGELLCAMAEIGMLAGLEFFVSVTDLFMERVLERADCQAERLGPPVRVGKVEAVAGFWEVGPESLARARRNAGITSSVLVPDDTSRIGIAA